MPPRRNHLVAMLCCLLGWAANGAPTPDRGLYDEALDEYLSRRGLLTMRIYTLEKLLPSATGAERSRVLSELAGAYEVLLETLPAEKRAVLRERSRVLLKDNPRPELAALRINLLKAEYLAAEQVAERQRLRLATETDASEAIASLKRLAVEFAEIAQAAGAKARTLDVQEQARGDASIAEETELKRQLADARRIRSLASYYAGWSNCYIAQLTKDREAAGEALLQFGALLNAQDRKPPTLDRLPKSLLVHEHVARACLGVAVCLSILGNDAEALRWLDDLSTVDAVPAAVRSQLLTRRITVLGAGSRWNELASWVQRARAPHGKVTSPLDAADAVLLAVTAFEGVDGPAPGGESARTELGRLALADLIARGQTSYVVALAKRFGTGALASDGFVAQYVRALQAFDSARARHRAAGRENDPARSAEIVVAYREAAALFGAAASAQDASAFESDATKAALNAGMALFYAGDFVPAADQFARVAQRARDADAKRDAVWFEVVALDRALEAGRKDIADRRDGAAALYVSTYPKTEQAARLLLKRAGIGTFSDAAVVESLLSVPEDSPIRHEAHVQASSLLFKLARGAPASERDEAFLRFLVVSDKVYPSERDAAVAADGSRREALAGRVLLLARQQLEAALSLTSPDTARAQKLLAEIPHFAELCGVPITDLSDELAYRRVQLAVASGDETAIDAAIASLKESSSPFAQGARMLALRRAIEASRAAPSSIEASRRVVAVGAPVVAGLDDQKQFDTRANAIRDEVAGAAVLVYGQSNETALRDLALRIDKGMYERGGRFTSSLRRLAELSEQIGDDATALECWKLLVSGLREEQPAWFEARYRSIVLMAKVDIAGARDAFRLFELSHPDFGPPAFAPRFQQLRERLLPAPAKGGGP
ncbi:MAG: hypothetical protein JNM86_05115 [Phycisphaerae bacterium]|nr:hypothetical protein [Phycisphaerae bacterium]MBN8598108.1 hypothetical protein [Planctomycetota bacterium]